jgi:hypothetical protein
MLKSTYFDTHLDSKKSVSILEFGYSCDLKIQLITIQVDQEIRGIISFEIGGELPCYPG